MSYNYVQIHEFCFCFFYVKKSQFYLGKLLYRGTHIMWSLIVLMIKLYDYLTIFLSNVDIYLICCRLVSVISWTLRQSDHINQLSL